MKKYINAKYIIRIILILVISFLLYGESGAIPAFARKYKTSCATCHIAVTKRNAFGEAFRRNGYVMPANNARMIKDPPLKLGAEAWKEAFPEAIWPSDIPGSIPVAACGQFTIKYNNPNISDEKQPEFYLPEDFRFLLGGGFGQDFGFFGSWSSLYGLYKIYLTVNDIAGPKHLLNLRIGLFEPGITDGYTYNQRLTLESANVLDYAAAGDWKPRSSRQAVEMNGIILHYLQYAVGITNSTGVSGVEPSGNKDYYGRIAYKFFGYGLDGEGIFQDSSNNDYWTDNSVTLGLYTYSGNSQKADSAKRTYTNEFQRFGADLRIKLWDFDLLGGAIIGSDNNPKSDGRNLSSTAYFIEGDYIFYPWLIGAIRYESVRSNFDDNDVDLYSNIIPNITILLRQNIRLSLESVIRIQGDRSIDGVNVRGDNDNVFKWAKLLLFFAF